MTDVDHVVGRLLERAQEQHRQRLLGRVANQSFQDRGQAERRGGLRGVEANAVAFGEQGEGRDLFLVGNRVDAPGGVLVARLEAPGHRLVGREHELLDHGVGGSLARIAACAAHVAHQAGVVVVELDHGLGQIEIQGPALLPLPTQLARQGIHGAQAGHERLVRLALAARVASRRVSTGGLCPTGLIAGD